MVEADETTGDVVGLSILTDFWARAEERDSR